MKKLNSRLILIHCVATLLNTVFFEVFSVVFMLNYMPFANQKSPQVNLNFAIENKLYIIDMYNYLFGTSCALLTALLISLIQSLLTVRKMHIYWVNSILAILFAIILYSATYRLFHLGQTSYYFNLKNDYFNIILKCTPFLLCSLFLFYSKTIGIFITRRNERKKQ